MINIGKQAPSFASEAVIDGNIKQIALSDYRDCYKLIFFYPLDFTFVCPTELHALQAHINEFKQRNTQIIGISVDSAHSHLAWLNTPKNKGGIEGVTYPLVADLKKTIARDYGTLNEELGIALRGTFLLDRNNIIQYAAIHNLDLGRNVSELLRVIDALTHVERNGEVCPADWTIGKKALKATRSGVIEYFN